MRAIAFAIILYFLKLQGLEGFQTATAPEVYTSTTITMMMTGKKCPHDSDCAYAVITMPPSMTENSPSVTGKPTSIQGCAQLNTPTPMPVLTSNAAAGSVSMYFYSSSQTLEMYDASGKSIPFVALPINSSLRDLGLTQAEIDAMTIPSQYDMFAFAMGPGMKALLILLTSAGKITLPAGVTAAQFGKFLNNSAGSLPVNIKIAPANFFTTEVLIGIGIGATIAIIGALTFSRGSSNS